MPCDQLGRTPPRLFVSTMLSGNRGYRKNRPESAPNRGISPARQAPGHGSDSGSGVKPRFPEVGPKLKERLHTSGPSRDRS